MRLIIEIPHIESFLTRIEDKRRRVFLNDAAVEILNLPKSLSATYTLYPEDNVIVYTDTDASTAVLTIPEPKP